MSAITTAVVADLTSEDLDRLAELLAPRLARLTASSDDADDDWMNSDEAARYLAAPRSRIQDLAQMRRIPFTPEGRRLRFRRSDLRKYLRRAPRGEGVHRARTARAA